MKDAAYTVVLEGAVEGRSKSGFYLGLATLDQPGYHQLKPGYGPYPTQDAARAHATELNMKLGHSPMEAMKIVLSSVRKQIEER